MSEITREMILEDFKRTSNLFKKKFPTSTELLTRDFYREKGKFKERDYNSIFGSFRNLTQEYIKEYKIDLKAVEESIEIQKKLLELKQNNRALQKDKKQLLKKSIQEDNILELYKENLNKEFKYPINNSKKKIKSNKDFLLNFSDLHLGEVVVPEQVNFVNEFNKEIAISRMDQLFDNLIRYAKKIMVQDLFIECNGDLFAGGIHQELVRNSDLNEVEAMFYLQRYLIPKLCELSNYFNHIYVDVIVGNHSRILTGKPYFKEKTIMNYEYIFGKQLQMYFDLLRSKNKNSKIFINVPDSPFIVKQIKNTKFLITHGDILTGTGTGGFLGLPAYSTAMTGAKLYGVLHQIGVTNETKFDHILAGHIHTTSKIPIFNGGFCFYGGCICGTNEFSLYKMKSVAKKEQLALIVDDNGIDGEINIRLT